MRERKKSDGVNGFGHVEKTNSSSVHQLNIKERHSLVLWRSPLKTSYFCILELGVLLSNFVTRLWKQKVILGAFGTFIMLSLIITHFEGPHQPYVKSVNKQLLWCSYWIGLGILSSVGFGTGLHTFVLYLGPHIAAVALAAFECKSTDFPEPPYPDDIICPDVVGGTGGEGIDVVELSIWTIMSKVKVEAISWGIGTAIGELPPYFVARASRLSGKVDEEEEEIEELISGSQQMKKLTILERGKILVHNLIQKVGFPGILLCASIPNPLFDLAGITCGHFLVPFWTFFGATLIGKAIIKIHIQEIFVIFVFSEHHVRNIVILIKQIPLLGSSLESLFQDYLTKQKYKLHNKGESLLTDPSWLAVAFEKLVMGVVLYFIASIINSLAQKYHKRQSNEKQIPRKKAVKV